MQYQYIPQKKNPATDLKNRTTCFNSVVPVKKHLYISFFIFLLTSICYGGVTYAQTDSTHSTITATDTLPKKDSSTLAADSVTRKGKKVVTAVDTFSHTEKEPHIYKMNYYTNIGFSILATAGNLYAIPNILHSKKELTDVELASLNPDIFNSIDRWALEQDPSKRPMYKKASDYGLPVVAISAGLLAFDKHIRKDWIRILLMYYETHALMFSLYNFSFFGPAFQNRLRPVTYYSYFSDADRRGGNNRNSFFSGHTANVAAASYFMAKVYSDYHPELGRKKIILYALATIPPLIEGYLRVKALEHFPSDVLAGLVMGGVSGIIVPSLHRYRKHTPLLQLGMTYTPTGPGLGVSWTPQSKNHKLLKTYVALHTNKSLTY